jgi:hypothetical protein
MCSVHGYHRRHSIRSSSTRAWLHLYSANVTAVACVKVPKLLDERMLDRSSSCGTSSFAESTELKILCSRLPGCLLMSPQVKGM